MNGSEQDKCACDIPRAEQIARLNDKLRTERAHGGIMLTRGVRNIPGFDPWVLMRLLAAYDGFDSDNNPYGERDFGDIELGDETLLWKIDYYDLDLRFASPDPTDPAVTKRILTVMLPEEF